MSSFKSFKLLVAMQLRSLIDFSFLKSKRATILKVGLSVISFALITVAFYVVFNISVLLSVFSFGKTIPHTVITVLFTIVQIMSIWSCMVGLSKNLYHGGDNVILLVLPVQQNIVFLSKLAVYYIFELGRNLMLTVPMFLAYGIINGAVWFYYPWMLFGYLFSSLLPVAIGSLLSIIALYVPKFVSRIKPIKYLILLTAAGALTYIAFKVVSIIPENINIMGQWGSITTAIRSFLNGFADTFFVFDYLTKMLVGGTVAIARNPVTISTLITFAINLGVCGIFIGISFITARVLFLKMTAKAGEEITRPAKQAKNRVFPKWFSPFSEDLLRNVRDGQTIWKVFIELFLPAFLIYALNRIYAAMTTSLKGQAMTASFNVLTLLITVLASNVVLAHAYSQDGSARNILKTRPVDFRLLLASRLVLRSIISTISIILAVVLYGVVSKVPTVQSVWFAIMASLINLSHIFLCGEIDIMNPESLNDNKNINTATVYAIIIPVLFTAMYFLLSGSGTLSAFIKLSVVSLGFLLIRAFLYFERIRIYFIET